MQLLLLCRYFQKDQYCQLEMIQSVSMDFVKNQKNLFLKSGNTETGSSLL